jgi:hypothetical protein
MEYYIVTDLKVKRPVGFQSFGTSDTPFGIGTKVSGVHGARQFMEACRREGVEARIVDTEGFNCEIATEKKEIITYEEVQVIKRSQEAAEPPVVEVEEEKADTPKRGRKRKVQG